MTFPDKVICALLLFGVILWAKFHWVTRRTSGDKLDSGYLLHAEGNDVEGRYESQFQASVWEA